VPRLRASPIMHSIDVDKELISLKLQFT